MRCAAPSSPISCPSSRDTCCPAPPQIRTVRNTSQISLAIRTPAVISNKNKELVTDLCDGSGNMTTENRLSLKARCQLAHLLDRTLVRHGHPGQNSLGPLELRIAWLQLPSAISVSPPGFQGFREHLLYLVRSRSTPNWCVAGVALPPVLATLSSTPYCACRKEALSLVLLTLAVISTSLLFCASCRVRYEKKIETMPQLSGSVSSPLVSCASHD